MIEIRRVFISGKVQNVGYRDWLLRHAREFGVTGWVRNLNDGRVETLVVGAEEAVAGLIEKCHEGPPLARVDHVESRVDEERPPKGFTKRFTA